MQENLREKCIYLNENQKFKDDEHIFFTYLYNMRFDCLEQRRTIARECAEEKMTELAIDVQKVQKCIEDSFISSNNFQSYNETLETDRKQAELYGVTLNPSIVINR